MPSKRRKTSADVSGATEADRSYGAPKAKRARVVRGKRGGLKNMLEMPVDILIEIFTRLDPGDLLNLARTTKDFRAFLTSRKFAWIWKEARSNIQGLPELPAHMNEVTYANLLFSPHCHNCGKGNVKMILWNFDARYCKDCKSKLLLSDGGFLNAIVKLTGIPFTELASQHILALACSTLDHLEVTPWSNVYHVHQVKEFCDRAETVYNTQQWADFEREKRAFIEARRKHVATFVSWEKEWVHAKTVETERVRRERLEAIYSRLRDDGWGKELDFLDKEADESFLELSSVRQPKPLTERSWQSIKARLFEFMGNIRERRLTKDRQNLLTKRYHIFWCWIRGQCPDCAGDDGGMLPVDYAAMPEVRAIIDVPGDVEVTVDSFLPLLPLLPELRERWFEPWKTALEDKLKAYLDVESCNNPLDLAAAYFDHGWAQRDYSRFPGVLSSCNIRTYVWEEDVYIQAIAREPGGTVKFPTRSTEKLELIKPARDIIGLIRLIGGDPLATTYNEIRKLQVLVRCTKQACEILDGTRCQNMTWDEAVDHLSRNRMHERDGSSSLEVIEVNTDNA
ncbi:hypothetical protein OBBRIDRAFT_750811 [Obba rivulosa]|uniref:F-box domain-containing protein n=1 Tax=Obba rivulosa TaxID=1052685 RepID=A0A8E2B2F1_9APHY|nr:hypothetical protein OBBRIDRAFT_750811 [Obba rivulosa]